LIIVPNLQHSVGNVPANLKSSNNSSPMLITQGSAIKNSTLPNQAKHLMSNDIRKKRRPPDTWPMPQQHAGWNSKRKLGN
jgi:hypothetical protein